MPIRIDNSTVSDRAWGEVPRNRSRQECRSYGPGFSGHTPVRALP